jgi:hypothetical protein
VQYSASAFLRALTGHNSKGLGHNRLGEHPSPSQDPDKRAVCPDILFLDFFRPGWLWPKFDIDHASHVSFYACMGFHPTTLFPKYVLTELSSYAIWDRNKVVLGLSAAIWVINLGFQLAGKSTSSIPL